MQLYAVSRLPVEFALQAERSYDDIFNQLDVDAVFTGPDGTSLRVPAFWAGGREFRVRFAAPAPGRYTFRTEATGADPGVHGVEGVVEAGPYTGENPLYRHGRIRVAENRRTFQHEDGTPFFWLADTWWMGLCQRLSFPGGFRTLTADRVTKGFTAIQIIAGLYPDMPAFDPRGANEAGFPWTEDYARIVPAYFDMADLRLEWLIASGLVPCIVGCWGYFLPWMGVPKLKQHWRNLIARYGAYPVVWCAAGEATMPYYLSATGEADAAMQKRGWTELVAYMRETDPYRNPITIHPTQKGRDQIDDPALLDFDMLQTGHGDRQSLPSNVNTVVEAYAREPRMPVLVGEVCYEGIGESCRQEVQRMMFWTAVLNGACGHTYGANGIWQLNTREQRYGPSPHGMSWGDTPWEEAFSLPGSAHLGLAARLLARYPWWEFQPHPEWVDPHWTAENSFAACAAGIPGTLRVIYFPTMPWGRVVMQGLEQGTPYRVTKINPATGAEIDAGIVRGDANGEWVFQRGIGVDHQLRLPLYQDWLVVMERV